MSDRRLLLCTDLDRTLLPNGEQPESPDARQRFSTLVSHPDVKLAFVSGRDKKLVEQAIKNYNLPIPDYVIADVGTTIYEIKEGGWLPWKQWQDEISPDWNGFDHPQLSRLFADIIDLRLQERGKQNTFKLSYYVPLSVSQQGLDAELQRRLNDHEVKASLVWSIDEPAGIGLLDVLPKCATKLHAVEFLQSHLGFSATEMLFAGDSGNDLPVLTSPIASVLVANAMPSVAQEAAAIVEKNGNQSALYLAKGGFLGMNGNYSAGILEGLAYYHPEWVEVINT